MKKIRILKCGVQNRAGQFYIRVEVGSMSA